MVHLGLMYQGRINGVGGMVQIFCGALAEGVKDEDQDVGH